MTESNEFTQKDLIKFLLERAEQSVTWEELRVMELRLEEKMADLNKRMDKIDKK
ncbi:hypothetical protein MACH09_45250 [Vibrio sp. MACH09]|uniref:hypothetical protein n=1 Tax=Vibrio sp. MACH09 TaxID=3025122 RepID=UPI0027916685|nr:hypothetical protein [Vibrio sp. MACH09]GLO64017.1 hypothetical protein MACH09_45250 [Vibrio sp. MACH09]